MRSQEKFAMPSRFVFHLQFTTTLGIFLVLLMAVAWASPAAAQDWTTLPGSATAISANAKGDVWAIGTEPTPGGYKIWRWNHGGWQNIAGGAERIAVDPDGTAWVVTSTGAIFHSNASGQWMPVSGSATDIAVGAKGDIWALGTARVGNEYGVWHAVVAPGTRNVTGWQAVSGAGVRIAVDAEGNPWVVTLPGNIFHLQGGHWVALPGMGLGEVKAISVGPDGVVYVVGPKDEARPGGFAVFRYQNSKWQPLNVSGIELAAGAAGTVYVIQNSSSRNAILSNSGRPTASYALAATPASPPAPVPTSAPAKPTVTPAASAKPTPSPTAPTTVSGPSSKPAPTGTAVASSVVPSTVATSAANPATTPAAAGATATSPSAAPTTAATPTATSTATGGQTASLAAPSPTVAPAATPPASNGPSPSSEGWTTLTGAAMDIGANGKGAIWVIGTNSVQGGYGIYQWVNGNWQNVPGSALRVSVDPDGSAWVVNNTGNIFHSSVIPSRAAVPTCDDARRPLQHCAPSGPAPQVQWTAQSGAATDIAVGANGDVWVIGTDRSGNDYGIYKAVFAPGTRNVSSWQKVDGGAVRIAVGPDGSPWVVNSNGNVFYRSNGAWAPLAINGVKDVSIGSDGTPYLTVSGGVIRLMPSGMNPSAPGATAWIPVPFSGLTATNVAAGAAGTVYITRDSANQNAILSKSGLPVASPTLAATAQPWSPPSPSQSASGAVPIASNLVTVTVPNAGTTAGNTGSSQPTQIVVAPITSTLTLKQPGPISMGPIGPNTGPGASPGSSTGSTTSGTLVSGQPTLISNGSGQLVSTTSNTPLQVTGLPYVPIQVPSGAVQLIPNLVYQKYVYVPGQFLCSDSENMGLGKGLAACGTTDAGYIGPYTLNTSCPSGSFYDIENGGECWKCPQPNDGKGTYIRSADPVTSPTACWRVHPDASNDATAAIFVQYNGCPDPTSTKVFPDARTPGQPFLDIASGMSVANNSGGACWTCPNSDAQGNYLSTDRNGNTLIGSQTGSSCTATHSCNNGCTVHFKYTPGTFVEPGLSGLAGARDLLIQEQIFQRPAALTTYLYGIAQANNTANARAWVAAQWKDIAAHPYGNAQMKALVHQFLIGDAPDYMYASGVQGQESTDAQAAHTTLTSAFQEYMQARNTYVAQEALDMYYAWKSDVAAQRANRAQSELETEFYYGTVPLDFQSIAQAAMAPPASATGVIGSIVGAQRYAAVTDSMRVISLQNTTKISTVPQRFHVSEVLSRLFKPTTAGNGAGVGEISEDFVFPQEGTGDSLAGVAVELGASTTEEAAADTAAILAAQIDLVSGPVGIALSGAMFAAMAIQQVVEIAEAEPNLLKAKNNAMQAVDLSQLLQQTSGPDQVATFWGHATGVSSELGDQTDRQLLGMAQTAYQTAVNSNFATLSPSAPPPTYTAFMSVSAGYLSLLRSITSAPSDQTANQIQVVMAQYNKALAQIQGVPLSSDQQAAVASQQQQVSAQVARVRALPGGVQATRKKLPGDD